MIIPSRHVKSPFDLGKEEWLAIKDLMDQAKMILDKYSPDGYNLGWNVGEVAGQEIIRTHLHIIARFKDEPLAGKGIRAHLKDPKNKRSTRK